MLAGDQIQSLLNPVLYLNGSALEMAEAHSLAENSRFHAGAA
jgi:hypothetical protein